VIYFVDMLASGFSSANPSTWTFKSVPGVSIMASHDEIGLQRPTLQSSISTN